MRFISSHVSSRGYRRTAFETSRAPAVTSCDCSTSSPGADGSDGEAAAVHREDGAVDETCCVGASQTMPAATSLGRPTRLTGLPAHLPWPPVPGDHPASATARRPRCSRSASSVHPAAPHACRIPNFLQESARATSRLWTSAGPRSGSLTCVNGPARSAASSSSEPRWSSMTTQRLSRARPPLRVLRRYDNAGYGRRQTLRTRSRWSWTAVTYASSYCLRSVRSMTPG
jgi:hypothetical protein